MADFGVNSTQLTEAQGRGTAPLQPVQEQVSKLGIMPIFGEITDIFAKGLVNDRKEKAAAQKKAVLDDYYSGEKALNDAYASGGINAAQHGARSRAHYAKFMGQFGGEYGEDLKQARSAFYSGTEAGEAQKKVDAETKQSEADLGMASSRGYSFYPGMSDEAKQTSIRAAKEALRIETDFDNREKRNSAQRAANAEGRAAASHTMAVDDYVAKDQAVEGMRTIASTNFDDMAARGKDLMSLVSTGKMPYEQAMAEHNSNVMRIRAGLASVAGKFPELASPWTKLFDDMDANMKQQLDPKGKSASELQLLKDQYEKLIITGKLAAVQRDPRMLNAVVGTELFRGDPNLVLAASAPVVEWINDTINVQGPNGKQPSQMVGTPNDAKLFETATKLIENGQTGKVPADKLEKHAQETAAVVNNLLKQTASVDGSLDPKALTQASKFFSSTAFGKLALEGKVDAQTAANAQHVFQVQYVPKVREAVINKLNTPFSAMEQEGYRGAKSLLDVVEAKLVGGQVRFDVKPAKSDGMGFFGTDAGQAMRREDKAKDMNVAAEAVNQLVRLHAHLEGTTDYAKYWEANKHVLLPNIFPDPAKLKPGQVVDGFKYTGGNVRDRNNWIAEPTKPAAK